MNKLLTSVAGVSLLIAIGCSQETGSASSTVWYDDADGDGFGNPGITRSGAVQPKGYVADNTDCDNADPNNFPGNKEVADKQDNNCNGIVDEGFTRIDSVRFNDRILKSCVIAAASKAEVNFTNELTYLDCRNLGITDATGIEQLTALTELLLSENALSRIDLASHTGLNTLNLRYNQLTSINLDANVQLGVADLRGNPLTKENTQYLDKLNIAELSYDTVLIPPQQCESGNDSGTGAAWIVCKADINEAWLSHRDKSDSQSFNALQICQALGYRSVSAWGGTWDSACGAKLESSTCSAPGVKKFDGGGGESSTAIGHNVHWLCTTQAINNRVGVLP